MDVLYKSRTRDMRNTLTIGDPGSSDHREIELGELQGLPVPGLWGMESPLHTVRNQEVLDFLLDFKKGDEHEDSFRDMISSRDARGFNVLRALVARDENDLAMRFLDHHIGYMSDRQGIQKIISSDLCIYQELCNPSYSLGSIAHDI